MFLMMCAVCFGARLDIGVISDTHARVTPTVAVAPYGDSPGYRITGYDDISVSAAVTTWNAASVDVCVFNGDIINGASGGPAVADNIQRLESDLVGLTSNAYFSAGNWDLGASINDARYQEFYADPNLQAAFSVDDDADKLWWPTAIADDTPVAYIKDVTAESQVFRLIFVAHDGATVDFSTAGEWDNDGAGAAAISQGDWFDLVLDDAESNGYPCIVFLHFRLVDTDTTDDYTGSSYVADGAEDATAITDMEAQTIPPIVIQGHVHYAQGQVVQNNVLYVDLRGDVWSPTTTDTNRYSHGVLSITYPAYVSGGKTKMQTKLTGYGYQESFDWIDPPVAFLRCEDTNGLSAADSIRDAMGTYHLDPAQAIVSATNSVTDSDNVYYTNRCLSWDGAATAYATDTSQSPVGTLPISVAFWIKTSMTPTADVHLVAFGSDTVDNRSLSVFIDFSAASKIAMATRDIAIPLVLPADTEAITDGEWHHVVAVWADTNDRKLYKDGSLVGSDTTDRADAMATLDEWAVGYQADHVPGTPSVDFFLGSLDEIMVYSGALTSTEVKTLYDQGKDKFADGPTGYRSRYR